MAPSAREEGFPWHGKLFEDFSTAWKKVGGFFHGMEKVFHGMENGVRGGGHRANAFESIDPFNARDASGAKGTQTPTRTARMGPPLRRFFSNGPETSVWDFQTGGM